MTEGKKVLLLEADMPAALALKHMLEREGLTVTHLQKGEQAFEAALAEKPDVILLGLQLLGALSGLDVMEQLNLHPMLSRIPVLIVTNFGMPQDVKKGLEAGAKEYLVKTDHSVHEIAQIAAKYAAKEQKK